MKLFRMNDCDWFMAESLEAAVALAKAFYGEGDPEMWNEARELTKTDLRRCKYYPDGNHNGASITFASALREAIERGDKPGFFASTEF